MASKDNFTGRPQVLLLLVVVMMAGFLITPVAAKGFYGLQGDFCRNRKPSECCTGRYDDCSVAVRGTFCYCDQFCMKDQSQGQQDDDCCPDFREVCLGAPPPSRLPADEPAPLEEVYCEVGGVRFLPNSVHKINCNLCECKGGKDKCEEDLCMVEEDLVERINSVWHHYGWRATNYSQFWGRKVKEGLTLKTGTFDPERLSLQMHPIRLRVHKSAIPLKFDARKEWQGRISDASDQGWCGASWVFSTLGVTQDRFNIIYGGTERTDLSAQNLLSCSRLGQHGCEGGHIDRAWGYLRRTGVVKQDCYPYVSGQSSQIPQCYLNTHDTSSLQCQDRHQYKSEPAYRISNKEEDIQWEILNNGPVQAIMRVYRDLFVYRSGVYWYSGVTGQEERAVHSVRILGWGEQDPLTPGSDPVKFWLVANSWGRDWGEDGLFRIKRGSNECGIESFVLTARARLANYVYGHKP